MKTMLQSSTNIGISHKKITTHDWKCKGRQSFFEIQRQAKSATPQPHRQDFLTTAFGLIFQPQLQFWLFPENLKIVIGSLFRKLPSVRLFFELIHGQLDLVHLDQVRLLA